MLKALSTSGAVKVKGQLKLLAQMMLTAEVKWRGCLVGMSPRVMRCHSHRNQEAVKNLPTVTKNIGWGSDPLRVTHALLGLKTFGAAGICQGACGTAGAEAGTRQHGHAWSGFMSLLWDLSPYLWSVWFWWDIRQPCSLASSSHWYYCRGYQRCHKVSSKEGKKSYFVPASGMGKEMGITLLWIYLSPSLTLYMCNRSALWGVACGCSFHVSAKIGNCVMGIEGKTSSCCLN